MTPSSAFGRLLKMAQNHLTKLKNEKPGLAVVLDKELGELISKINSFPVMFNLEDQGRFAIGYYHQKQESFRKASENKELREAVEE
jgi:CRISPR-associated protein Csd1